VSHCTRSHNLPLKDVKQSVVHELVAHSLRSLGASFWGNHLQSPLRNADEFKVLPDGGKIALSHSQEGKVTRFAMWQVWVQGENDTTLFGSRKQTAPCSWWHVNSIP
jgi:hypothetical protein